MIKDITDIDNENEPERPVHMYTDEEAHDVINDLIRQRSVAELLEIIADELYAGAADDDE